MKPPGSARRASAPSDRRTGEGRRSVADAPGRVGEPLGTRQILAPAIKRANVELAKHETGATPAYVTAQMGQTDAALVLEIYSNVMERRRDIGTRMDALVRGVDRAPTGTNGGSSVSRRNESP